MNFKLIKDKNELKNFVDKYKNEFEYMYEVVTESAYEEVNKESILEYIEFMYKHLKLDRFLKDYIILIEQRELSVKVGNMYIEVEEFYALPDSDYQKKRYDYITNTPSFLNNNKFNDFLFNLLSCVKTDSVKKDLPLGILLEEYFVDEIILKQYLGISEFNIGTEFEIEFTEEQKEDKILIRRKFKCKLLDYKKELKEYKYRIIFLINRNYDNYYSLNEYDKKYLMGGFFRSFLFNYKNMLDLFLSNFVFYYDIYINNKYNLNVLSNLLDYEKNRDEILIFINDFYLKESKKIKDEFTYRYTLSQLNVTDIRNFNKEYAHYLYLELYYNFKKLTLENIRYYGLGEISLNSWKHLYLDQNFFENLFLRNKKEGSLSYLESMEIDDRQSEDYLSGNIWVKGYGKYVNV